MNDPDENAHLIRCVLFLFKSWENIPDGICAQQRLKSAWTFAQSDESFPSPDEETCLLGY